MSKKQKITSKVIKNVSTKGFQEVTMKLEKPKDAKITLNELKDYMKDFDDVVKEKKNSKDIGYWVIARNHYGIKTIRQPSGHYFDEQDGEEYYNKRNYQKSIFDTFDYVEIVMNIDKPSKNHDKNNGFMFGNKK